MITLPTGGLIYTLPPVREKCMGDVYIPFDLCTDDLATLYLTNSPEKLYTSCTLARQLGDRPDELITGV